MYFKFVKTKSEVLGRYLDGFYIIEKTDPDKDLRYIVFSSNRVIISLFRQAIVDVVDNGVNISESTATPFLSIQIMAVREPLYVQYKGRIRELALCFRPLGLNYFLNGTLKQYYQKTPSTFEPFTDFKEVMDLILREPDETILLEQVEDYWLSRLQQKKFSLLENAINSLQSEEEISVQQIADEAGISRQHLFRLFERHLCKTPSHFRKIHRFRNTLKNRVDKLKITDSLTSLTYESLFYDQSHFIKDFKSITGMTPSRFFEQQLSFENGQISWVFPD
ncbi:helix-turn-helix domain-containing protein [Niabella sp. CJ426]|uniref:helix-turn-helix domain-containing protein n=1 Tax=Niabella sp. CJ426 TaxID=3393740 RepID=UPI003CFF1AA5